MASSDKAANARFFDGIAGRYDAYRPTYPAALIDRGCEIAGLRPGDPVLEIGPGTGHLTIALDARGLVVTAVEPGSNLIAIAQAKTPAVNFLHTTLERAKLRAGYFRAVFAASSIHWPDPEVSWRLVADALVPGGTLALVSFLGLATPEDDQAAQLSILKEVAPEMFASFPRLPTQEELFVNAERHRDNISEAWQPYTLKDIARTYVADLFDDVQLDVVVDELHQTATQTVDVLGTMSFARLSEDHQTEIAERLAALEQKLGRPLRTTRACLLMTARRHGSDVPARISPA
jgi:SAM-dependent methyltransferase